MGNEELFNKHWEKFIKTANSLEVLAYMKQHVLAQCLIPTAKQWSCKL